MYGGERALAEMIPDWGAIVSTAPSAGSEGTILLRREDTRRRALVLLVEDILARLAGVTQTDAFRVGAAEVRLVDFEPDVVRELVANAFAHRDWEQPSIIDIGHSPDGLVVTSPGGLLPTLHVSRLLRESAQRNRVLSREITRLRITEGAGMGFDRVYRSLAAAGKEPPRIEVGCDSPWWFPAAKVIEHSQDSCEARSFRMPASPETWTSCSPSRCCERGPPSQRRRSRPRSSATRIPRMTCCVACTVRACLSRLDPQRAGAARRID